MLRRLRVFLLGMWEFRDECTTHFGESEISTYDLGREWAHKLTLRHWDQSYEA